MEVWQSIDQLMEETPEATLVKRDGTIFTPKFRTASDQWHGLNKVGYAAQWWGCSQIWQIYKPKPNLATWYWCWYTYKGWTEEVYHQSAAYRTVESLEKSLADCDIYDITEVELPELGED